MAFTRTYTTTDERLKPSLRFFLYTPEYEYEFTDMVQSHGWDGDINTAHESFSVNIWNRKIKSDERRLPFTEGYMVKVMLDYPKEKGLPRTPQELFRGIITKRDINAEGTEQLAVVDYNWYLHQNKVTKSYRNMTATQICKDLCRTVGVPASYIANTGHLFGELEFIEKTVWEIIQIVLTETYLKTGKHYITQSEGGKFALREVVMSNKRLLVERGFNMLGATRSVSIENVKTQVTVTNETDGAEFRSTNSSDEARKKYGTLATIEKGSGDEPVSVTARKLLEELKKPEDTLSVEGLADYTISKGTVIEAFDVFTGASGYYFVTAHSHSDADSMSLELSKTYDANLVRYENPNKGDETSSGGNASTKFEGVNYKTNFVATAYDPALGGINGSGDYKTTASGTKWAYKRTIAVDPNVIPYGSVVHIIIPSLPQYNGLYLAEDTGGAIKGNRIDILIKGKDATAKFGRRDAQVAIVSTGSGRGDARNKANNWKDVSGELTKKLSPKEAVKTGGKVGGKAGDIISLARSFTGKLKYSFGGKNILSGAGDCSGFTYHIYKQLGINIGHGTSSQVMKGQKISPSAARPGDLVFFKGTYRAGVSHVGIVTSPGMCVSLASSGCQEHSYTMGYWGGKFMQINRVLPTTLEDGSVVQPGWFK